LLVDGGEKDPKESKKKTEEPKETSDAMSSGGGKPSTLKPFTPAHENLNLEAWTPHRIP